MFADEISFDIKKNHLTGIKMFWQSSKNWKKSKIASLTIFADKIIPTIWPLLGENFFLSRETREMTREMQKKISPVKIV